MKKNNLDSIPCITPELKQRIENQMNAACENDFEWFEVSRIYKRDCEYHIEFYCYVKHDSRNCGMTKNRSFSHLFDSNLDGVLFKA